MIASYKFIRLTNKQGYCKIVDTVTDNFQYLIRFIAEYGYEFAFTPLPEITSYLGEPVLLWLRNK